MIYPYVSHYLYDILVIGAALVVGKQLFNFKVTKKQFVAFLLFMMFFYQINFYVTEAFFVKEYKYVVLYMGMLLAYMYILKLRLIAALIVIVTTTALNGIWTNINLIWMLHFLFDNYGDALDAKHLQYSCYTLSVIVLNSLMVLFKVRIVDIRKYN
jgi:hypothetical protein